MAIPMAQMENPACKRCPVHSSDEACAPDDTFGSLRGLLAGGRDGGPPARQGV